MLKLLPLIVELDPYDPASRIVRPAVVGVWRKDGEDIGV